MFSHRWVLMFFSEGKPSGSAPAHRHGRRRGEAEDPRPRPRSCPGRHVHHAGARAKPCPVSKGVKHHIVHIWHFSRIFQAVPSVRKFQEVFFVNLVFCKFRISYSSRFNISSPENTCVFWNLDFSFPSLWQSFFPKFCFSCCSCCANSVTVHTKKHS